MKIYPAYSLEDKIFIEVKPDKLYKHIFKSISKLTTYLAHSNGARYVILESMQTITSKKQDNFNGLTNDDFNNLLSKPGLAQLEQLGYSVRNATPHITRVSNTEVGWYKHYYNRNT